jgi:pimeloyl-ACP methyl ester carboxylesterase
MSGSGKSEGEKITYGLKEQEDISSYLFILEPVIDYLHKKKAIKEFVIWGRSMGAVAALLYAINHPSLKYRSCRKERYHFSAKQSLKNSAIVSKDDTEYPVILGLVLDSPFCNFR